MLKTFGAVALLGAVLTAPSPAQDRKTEFGVDVSFSAEKASGGGDWVIIIRTPVDFRVAIPMGRELALEPRIAATFATGGGNSVYTLDPGVNVLIGFPGSTYNKGMYGTFGADLTVLGGSEMTTASYVSFNVGFGGRSPLRSAAWRPELFLRFTPKQGTTVTSSIVAIGARIGLSFFN
jgi:hypothetical protein